MIRGNAFSIQNTLYAA